MHAAATAAENKMTFSWSAIADAGDHVVEAAAKSQQQQPNDSFRLQFHWFSHLTR
jgi:hypothetical protein